MPNSAQNIAEWLLPRSLSTSGEGRLTAIRFKGRSVSYAELLALANRSANALRAVGLGARDCVALILPDSPHYFAAFLGAMNIGAVPALLSTFLEDRQLEFIVNLCSARCALADARTAERIELLRQRMPKLEHIRVCGPAPSGASLPASGRVVPFDFESSPDDLLEPAAPCHDDDPAFFLFTSGSTGEPKAVVHAHADIRHTVESYGHTVLKLTREDRVFSSSRLFFAYGLGNSFSFPLVARATSILCEEKPTPEVIARIFRDESPTVFFSVPAVFRALLNHHRRKQKLATASLRYCVSAGEALPANLFDEWKKEFGLEILDGIGTTEALHMFLSNYPGRARAGSSGTVVEGYEARIVNEAGQDVDAGVSGNLWVRGESFGYYYMNSQGFTAKAPPDWVATGDVYRRDAKGYFYYCGRSADHFKVQGLWVAPQMIEEAITGHEAVEEAGVVGVKGPDGLTRPVAFVVVKSGRELKGDELNEFLASRLHSYQMPAQIKFIPNLPRTATGKLQRFLLRAAMEKCA